MWFTRAHITDEVTPLERAGKAVSRQAAIEGIVLLENDGVLPLAPTRIALFGNGACMTVAGGTGSGEVNTRHSVSVREGLEAAGFDIATSTRLDAYETAWLHARAHFIEEQRKKMRTLSPAAIGALINMDFLYPPDEPIRSDEIRSLNTDICIYVIARQSGEAADRTDEPGSFRLTPQELSDLRVCEQEFGTTIVVLNVGAPIDVSWRTELEGMNALVLMGQLGMEGGHALADVLTGAASPSGKLCISWPESLSHVPCSESFGRASAGSGTVDYAEGIFVGYRFYSTFGVTPAYPFGYGLSYTCFETRNESVACRRDSVTVNVTVRNAGSSLSGKHVVQIYAACPRGKLAKERCRLVAFAKTRNLAPGESAQLALEFTLRDLASYDEETAETVLEPGRYDLFIGETPATVETADPVFSLNLATRRVLEQHRNLCVPSQRITQLAGQEDAPDACRGSRESAGGNASEPTDVQTFDPASFAPIIELDTVGTPIRHRYGSSAAVLPEIAFAVDALSDSQMIKLCVGTGRSDEGKGLRVPGAVGHTTASLIDAGIPALELCDGPAGLRVQRRSAISKSGSLKPIDPPMSFYEALPRSISRFIYGNAERDLMVYQFATGFPAASSIAQTWNVELARAVGETVGREMAEYGVTYWLAPALNIVRNPLCGRNFEYYSEDPLISGKMAAAVTSGVQAEPGRYACLKHFAANNQETDRITSSSNLDERTLREIYLRGFEIAVRDAQPASIMASYNKINGIYATENADLLTGILRDEWHFDGIVMTDWYATGFGHANECAALSAGVDLIMPGGKLPATLLALGLKTGVLPRVALQTACARMLTKALGAAVPPSY